MATKFPNAKPRASRTKVDKAIHAEDHINRAEAQAQHAFEVNMPSERRVLVATCTSLFVGVLGGWATGNVASLLMFAAVAYTGSAFLSCVVGILALVLGIMTAIRASNSAFRFVVEFDIAPLCYASSRVRSFGKSRLTAVKSFATSLYGGSHA